MKVKICRECHHQNPIDIWHCQNCGESLAEDSIIEVQDPLPKSKVCPQCQMDNAESAKFCKSCGSPFNSLARTAQASNSLSQVQTTTRVQTMEKWEYLTHFLWANIDTQGAKEFIRKTWPNSELKKYMPETLIPILNSLGEQGWELVHMEPIQGIGSNYDIETIFAAAGNRSFSNVFFCVFKRRKAG